MNPVKAPFPAFGGKWPVAGLTWTRLGTIQNFIAPNYRSGLDVAASWFYEEPFANSLAIMLNNPAYDWGTGTWSGRPPVETVNDLDEFIANFWRSVKHDPEGVAHYADYPVTEIDLNARHRWLMEQAADGMFARRMMDDPDFYDVKIAGWWTWGAGAWVGSGWCNLDRVRETGTVYSQRPNLSSRGMGVHKKYLPGGSVLNYMTALADRLRLVRVVCGDWSRVTGKSVTWNHNSTRSDDARVAIVLDPPYAAESGRMADLYGRDDLSLAHDVREWAIQEGKNPKVRIALFGYDLEHAGRMPESWECIAWSPNGGYQNQSGGQNKMRERIWFSPYCLKDDGALDLEQANQVALL